MTVAELIEELRKLPPDTMVMVDFYGDKVELDPGWVHYHPEWERVDVG